MPLNSDIIISDTSCLIILAKIGELNLLGKLGKNVWITPAIEKEFGNKLPSWIKIKEPKDSHYQ